MRLLLNDMILDAGGGTLVKRSLLSSSLFLMHLTIQHPLAIKQQYFSIDQKLMHRDQEPMIAEGQQPSRELSIGDPC